MYSIPCFTTIFGAFHTALRQLATWLGAVALLGCASGGGIVGSASTGVPSPAAVTAIAPDQDVLLHLLHGQFALQSGDRRTAADAFAKAAQLSTRPEVAELATELAIGEGDRDLARTALARWQVLAPQADGLAVAVTRLALADGDLVAARTQLLALLARDGTDAWRDIAQILLPAADRAGAAALLDELATPAQLGEGEKLWVAVSQLAYRLGDEDLAARLAAQATMHAPGEELDIWRARLALDDGDVETATLVYRQAYARDPQSLRIRMGYASLLSEAGKHDEAARVLVSGRQTYATYAARAAYAARADDEHLLESLYVELAGDPSVASGPRLNLLGQLAELAGRDEDALQWYRQVSRDDEQWFGAQLRMIVLGDRHGAVDTAERLVRLRHASADDADALGRTYLLEAELQEGRGEHERALQTYDSGLAALPQDTRIRYARALAHVQANRIEEGERDLRIILEQEPDNGEALNALGYTLADRTDRLHEALELITRALALRPGEAAIIDSLGWVYFRLGAIDQAITRLREALRKQPDAEIAAHLGEVLWAAGEHDDARATFDEARQLDADNATLRDTLQRLGL